eukprot:1191841-Prorocentrum_minimum.AAC.1
MDPSYLSPQAQSFLPDQGLVGVEVVLDSHYISKILAMAYDLSKVTKATQRAPNRTAMDLLKPRRPHHQVRGGRRGFNRSMVVLFGARWVALVTLERSYAMASNSEM